MTTDMARKIISETPPNPNAEQMRLFKLAVAVLSGGGLKPPGVG